MATVMLIDGNSLTYRAFFALPTDMATASGQVIDSIEPALTPWPIVQPPARMPPAPISTAPVM